MRGVKSVITEARTETKIKLYYHTIRHTGYIAAPIITFGLTIKILIIIVDDTSKMRIYSSYHVWQTSMRCVFRKLTFGDLYTLLAVSGQTPYIFNNQNVVVSYEIAVKCTDVKTVGSKNHGE